MTPLDKSASDLENDAGRLRYFDQLVATEMFLLLEAEPTDEGTIKPLLFPIGADTFALGFDSEERLASFAEREAPYAALSGRALIDLLSGAELGLGVNLQTAPSEHLLSAGEVKWVAGLAERQAAHITKKISEISAPAHIPETVLTTLDGRLARMAGLARSAYLVSASYDDGSKGAVLALTGTAENAQNAITQSLQDAITFSGETAGWLDILFIEDSATMAAKIAKYGLRFDIPEPEIAPAPTAPGSDPTKPPKLR